MDEPITASFTNKFIIISMYVLIIVLGFVGNICLCYVLVKVLHVSFDSFLTKLINKKIANSRIQFHELISSKRESSGIRISKKIDNRRSSLKIVLCAPTNYFILNLAIADLCMVVVCVPFNMISDYILGYWPYGSNLCKIISFLQATSIMASVLTMTVLTVDRYMTIMSPINSKRRITISRAKFIIILIWFMSSFISLPIPLVSRLEFFPSLTKNIQQKPLVNNTTILSKILLNHVIIDRSYESRESSFVKNANLNNIYRVGNDSHSKNFLMDAHQPNPKSYTFCREDWFKNRNKIIFSAVWMFFHYVVPFGTLLFAYINIGKKLNSSNLSTEFDGHYEKVQKSRIKV
ncbi:unnamed protein product [Gordionus sp. m RMFG-2023]|uniref:alpha-2 adrenergic receptor-like n=1 Tax=Gordionus sp. m RMFG-2023 TaxID=3053472 RepID=UPI0030E549BB